MIFIAVRFTARPDHADRWLDLVADFTRATREEPGNLFFDWSRSVDDPNVFVLLEAFADAEGRRGPRRLPALHGRSRGHGRSHRHHPRDHQRRGPAAGLGRHGGARPDGRLSRSPQPEAPCPSPSPAPLGRVVPPDRFACTRRRGGGPRRSGTWR